MVDRNYKYIDIFAGCGGLSLGLHNSGWKGVFAIEKNKDAFETLQHNLIKRMKHFDWPHWLEEKEHDINDIIENHYDKLRSLKGKIDLVVGGPPCQGFSLAGKRNEQDERNSLINSYIDFIKAIEPRMVFFENVKGFTINFKNQEQSGRRYSSFVVDELVNLGYSVRSELINFSEYGIPQKRTRFILVGVKKKTKPDENFEINNFFELLEQNFQSFIMSKNISPKTTLSDAISDLKYKHGQVSSETPNFLNGIYGDIESNYQMLMRSEVKITNNVDSHRFVNHTKKIIDRFQVALTERLTPKAYRERFELKKSSTKLLSENKPTPTLTTLPDDYIHYCEPRILTVREYARIQSFPDSFHFKGKYTTGGSFRTSDVPRYSQIGNAIPPLFAEQCGLILKELIND